jgi:hypothetical protein
MSFNKTAYLFIPPEFIVFQYIVRSEDFVSRGSRLFPRGLSFENRQRIDQGCQMVYFQTKNSNFGKFLRALDWRMLIHLIAIWNILMISGKFYDNLVHLGQIWYIFSGFGITYQQ